MASKEIKIGLIQNAFNLGITHFDTAPLYGDGCSETVLGESARPFRSSITIATKVGLLPSRWIGRLGTASWPIHAGRSLLRKLKLMPWFKRSFTKETLRQSVPESLRALRTDYLDVLFLHEPLLSEVEENDEVFEELMRLKQSGVIRFTGISGPIFPEVLRRYGSAIDLVQTMESAWDAHSAVIPDLTFSALGRRAAGPAGEPDSAGAALVRALARRPQGGVIVGTTQVSHLRELVDAANGFTQSGNFQS